MTEETLINELAIKMNEKILERRNRYAPMGWTTMDPKRILSLLEGEIKEYKETPNKDEAVDIANYALFLWYLTKDGKHI